MIEINLVPDVKLELIKARKVRTAVISLAILISLIAGGVVALLGVYTFAVQGVAQWSLDRTIEDEKKKLDSVQGLSEMLTIQSQLGQLSEGHAKKLTTSRLFDVLTKVVPTGKNSIAISKVDLDAEGTTVTIEGEASNGYEALEVFKKTLAASTFVYTKAGEGEQEQTVNITSDIQDQERSFGENSNGKRVLRFSMSFTYAADLFASNLAKQEIKTPNQQNATDSAKGVPKNLFTDSATPPKEEGQ
ncbi:MAG TPA: hypothetical protein VGE34_04695 [Candidatus Saccharimonadales bacterium]